MRRLFGFVALAALAFLALAPAYAQETTFSPEQKTEIGAIVRQYLIDHPEVIKEAIEALQAREDQAKQQSQAEALKLKRDDVFNDPNAPVGGNPSGDVTIVEFFDYRCPYCKHIAAPLEDLLKADQGIRLVYKEFPILGDDSLLASQAALAVAMQGKYPEFHQALMSHKGSFDLASLKSIASSLGIDAERMVSDMNNADIRAKIIANRGLADALQISSTPTFVIGNEIVAGAMPIDDMKELVRKARGS